MHVVNNVEVCDLSAVNSPNMIHFRESTIFLHSPNLNLKNSLIYGKILLNVQDNV